MPLIASHCKALDASLAGLIDDILLFLYAIANMRAKSLDLGARPRGTLKAVGQVLEFLNAQGYRGAATQPGARDD